MSKGPYLGEYEELSEKRLEELIEEFGTDRGISVYFAVHSVEILENGNWEDVEEFIFEHLNQMSICPKK